MMIATCIRTFVRRASGAALLSLVVATLASAQTTITLSESGATTLRGGTYASTNLSDSSVLVSRASAYDEYKRTILLEFDTNTTTSPGSPIASAYLTLTVAAGRSETRQLSAYHLPTAYDPATATWNGPRAGEVWSQPGGDRGARYAVQPITDEVASKVTFDVTALVQASVRGEFGGSRVTRLLLVDEGQPSQRSYKEIYSSGAPDVAQRPTLVVTTATSAPPPDPDPPVRTLRVLHWNTHHGGYGTDNRYDPDRLATWIVRMTPDVVMLNEIEKFTGWGNQDQPEVYKNLLETKTGKIWYYLFAQEYGNWSAKGKGNLILSSVPFDSTDMYEIMHNGDRSVAEASLTWNGRRITFFLTHLDPDSYSLRLTQATELTDWMSPKPEDKILTGDMNAWPDQESIAHLNKYFHDSWTVAASQGTTVTFPGNTGQTKRGRIDYIYYSKGSTNLSVKSSQVYDTRDGNGIMPSDHRPVLTTFIVQ